MTWKGTFCTEYAWSLCGSSLLFSRACGRPQAATNTPRSPPNLFAFLSSHSSLLPPTHFVRESHLLSHSNRRRLATLPCFSSRCFSPRSSCLHRVFSQFFGRSCFVRRRCCGALCAKRGGFLGEVKALPVCLCKYFGPYCIYRI